MPSSFALRVRFALFGVAVVAAGMGACRPAGRTIAPDGEVVGRGVEDAERLPGFDGTEGGPVEIERF